MNMTRTLQIAGLASLVTLSPIASADTIFGLYVGAGIWQADFSGSASESGTGNNLDFDDEFGSVEEDSNFLYIAVEHPIPVIPNIMLQQTDVSVDESATLSTTITFDGQDYTAGESVDAIIDFSHMDATLYYEILDNWVTADIGFTFRQFDGELSLVGTSGATNGVSAAQELDGVIPMLYAKARFDLPLTGFYVGAHGNFIGIDGHSLTDFSGAVGYESDGFVLDFGLELGLRTFTFELDDLDDLDADIELSGMYAAFTIHF